MKTLYTTFVILMLVLNGIYSQSVCDATSSFRCLDGKGCLSIGRVCDNVKDCPDGSDEAMCNQHPPENFPTEYDTIDYDTTEFETDKKDGDQMEIEDGGHKEIEDGGHMEMHDGGHKEMQDGGHKEMQDGLHKSITRRVETFSKKQTTKRREGNVL